MVQEFDVTYYGAVGDGKTDCTDAIQAAIDKAGEQTYGGLVVVPPGIYLVSTLRLHPHVRLCGTASWSFRSGGGSTLKSNDSSVNCMLDITKAYGCTINGLCLDGAKLGKEVHGILFNREDFFDHKEEDTFKIEDCQIRNFTGSGLYLHYACCFCVRHSHIIDNGGDGIYLNSWDGFILDNQLSANGGWGIRCAEEGINNSAMTLIGNRVEWNRKGGFLIQNAKLWTLNGNFFDRSGGPAIHIAKGIDPTPEMDPRWVKISSHAITVTGNIFNRSGADFDNDIKELDSSHIRIHECFNVTVTGNVMLAGMDDGMNEGKRSPQYGIVAERLKGCVIASNTLYKGYTLQDIKDLGEHGEQVVMEHNMSSIVPESDFIDGGHMFMRWDN